MSAIAKPESPLRLPANVPVLTLAEAASKGLTCSISYAVRHTVGATLLPMLAQLRKDSIPSAIVCVKGTIGEGRAFYEVRRSPMTKPRRLR